CWMWVSGVVWLASHSAEAYLGVRFRGTAAAGEKSGGPQYCLARGIKGPVGKVLALMFAIFAVIACFGIGNMTEGNAIASNVESSWNVLIWVTGLIITVPVMLALVGGIKSIGRVTAGLVPIMVIFYVFGAIYILLANLEAIPG